MSQLSIQSTDGQTAFWPTERISGVLSWQLDEPATAIELRLFWYTRGKGTTDVGVVDRQRVEAPASAGEYAFAFELPETPCSFSGKLISLIWAIEAIVEPGEFTQRLEIVVSPTRQELLLEPTQAPGAG